MYACMYVCMYVCMHVCMYYNACVIRSEFASDYNKTNGF